MVELSEKFVRLGLRGLHWKKVDPASSAKYWFHIEESEPLGCIMKEHWFLENWGYRAQGWVSAGRLVRSPTEKWLSLAKVKGQGTKGHHAFTVCTELNPKLG
ncbi:hypothetical protein XENTR_v10015166 [Xenopus tropicalis]|nr:hypothetical protein XENTR_v10015166 [Xenopus tropicalis]